MIQFLKKNKWFFIKWLIVLTIIIVCLVLCKVFEIYAEEVKIENYPIEIEKTEAILNYDEYKSKLIKEVDKYIDSIAPTSNLTGYAIVDNSEKYGLDIKFVLAQGQIESHFGTTGMAVKTNNVFNVGAYDNRKVEEVHGKFKYRHPDYSIEPYMQLLYRDYITGTKTELDLMGKYVNKNGQRYSTSSSYERTLFDVYVRIDSCTKITKLQGEMKRYKIISGV